MKRITEKRIDKAIDAALLKVSENFLNDYQENEKRFSAFINAVSGSKRPHHSSQLASELATYKTARDHAVEIMRSALKELLCE